MSICSVVAIHVWVRGHVIESEITQSSKPRVSRIPIDRLLRWLWDLQIADMLLDRRNRSLQISQHIFHDGTDISRHWQSVCHVPAVLFHRQSSQVDVPCDAEQYLFRSQAAPGLRFPLVSSDEVAGGIGDASAFEWPRILSKAAVPLAVIQRALKDAVAECLMVYLWFDVGSYSVRHVVDGGAEDHV